MGAAALAVALLLGACGGSEPDASPPSVGTRILTIEEAGLVVQGELFRMFGEEADPVALRLSPTRDTLDGRPVWRFAAVVEATVEGRRTQQGWTFWVGVEDGQVAVVRSEGPTPIG